MTDKKVALVTGANKGIGRQIAKDLAASGLIVLVGTRSVEEGAREAVRLALIGPDGPTGTFSDENGPVAW